MRPGVPLLCLLAATACQSPAEPGSPSKPAPQQPPKQPPGDTACPPGSTKPPAESDCSDGSDDDSDGLLDCEDSDCFHDEACVETLCEDEQDNDGDGLIDCEDLDCVDAEARCQDHVVHVYGGRMEIETRYLEVGTWYSAERYTTSATLSGVYGDVQVRVGDEVLSTCMWSLANADFSQERSYRRTWLESRSCLRHTRRPEVLRRVQRAGFWIEPACGLQSSGFLPDRLWLGRTAFVAHGAFLPRPRVDMRHAPGDQWYRGPRTYENTWRSVLSHHQSSSGTTVHISPLSR